MKRKRLAELVREEVGTLEAPVQEASPQGGLPEEAPAPPEAPKERSTPKYLTYVRKECRLRPDQLDALTALARKLNRERKGGERITENTLVRAAVDLLLLVSQTEPSLLLQNPQEPYNEALLARIVDPNGREHRRRQ